MKRPLILIKGAGDLASGIALRLYRSGLTPIMTELAQPTAVRRTVAFSEAITTGYAQVEDCRAVHAAAVCEARRHAENHVIAVLTDEPGISVKELQPDVLIDAIIAKRNLGTALQDAPAVIAVGPGFTAGVDCHAVVETARGHTLGRVYYADSNCRTALPNTGIPGEIGG
ncbi:MAG: molybdenum hydroxylase, partial [Spirochaetaceae bacterium]|nr:molybdenum hydroxylase [Spirochaetaceae bacterium]